MRGLLVSYIIAPTTIKKNENITVSGNGDLNSERDNSVLHYDIVSLTVF